MNLKFLLFSFGIQALPLLTDTYNSANFDSSSSNGYGCQRCIRNGWVYATTQEWFSLIPEGSDYIGDCCQTLGPDCANAYDAAASNKIKSGYRASSLDFASKDLAIAACPTKKDVCGPIRELNITRAMSYSDDNWKANLGFLGDWTTKDSCTYLVKQDVNAPYLKFAESKNVDDGDVLLHYVEWSDHGKADFNKDSKYSPWPPLSTSVPNIMDDQDTKYPDLQAFYTYQGDFFMPNLKQEVTTGVFRSIPGSIIWEWMTDFSNMHTQYQRKKQTYEQSVRDYKKECDNLKWKIMSPSEAFFSGFGYNYAEQFFQVEYPHQPQNYSGPIPDDMQIEFGFGSLSAGTIKLRNLGEFKIFGSVGLMNTQNSASSIKKVLGGYIIPTPLSQNYSSEYIQDIDRFSELQHNFSDSTPLNNYVAITILPNVANSDSSKKAVVQVGASTGFTKNMTITQHYDPIEEFDWNGYRKKAMEDAGIGDLYMPTYRIQQDQYYYYYRTERKY